MVMRVAQQVDLSAYTGFGVSARAAHFADITGEEELIQALAYGKQHYLPVFVLGGGTNVLFVRDFPGLILYMNWQGIDWLDEAGLVRAACGENWHSFVINCMTKGFHGLENLALIPGTVGAAPIQNIGAYGVELEQFLVEVRAVDTRTGRVALFDHAACEFAYRDSLFKQGAGRHLIVTHVTLQLSAHWQPNLSYQALRDALTSETPTAEQVFETVCQLRRSKLPDPAITGNAGSFFKNPVISSEKFAALQVDFADIPCFPTDDQELVKVPAAWLLEQAGWKGRQRGRAAVSAEHALVLVNPGEATGEDIFLLAQEMSSSILQRFGIALQPEVQII